MVRSAGSMGSALFTWPRMGAFQALYMESFLVKIVPCQKQILTLAGRSKTNLSVAIVCKKGIDLCRINPTYIKNKARGVARIFPWGGGAKPSTDPTGEQVRGLPPENLYNF